MDTFLATVFLIVCVLLVVLVLLQKGRGGGIGGLFGGGGSSAFGTRTGDVFTWVTIVLVALFLLLAVGITLWFRPERHAVSPPTFNPTPHPIDRPALVRIDCRTTGADIHFTLDGAQPTRASHKYDAPVRIEAGTVVKARAFLQGWDDSPVTTGTYMHPVVRKPALKPPYGPIEKAVPVTINCQTPGAKIHFTVDGSPPTRTSPEYTVPVRVQPGTILKARAFLAGWPDSPIASGTYRRSSDAPPYPPDTRPAPAPAASRPTPAATRPASAPAP